MRGNIYMFGEQMLGEGLTRDETVAADLLGPLSIFLKQHDHMQVGVYMFGIVIPMVARSDSCVRACVRNTPF